GGVKTVVFAVTVLNIRSVLQGKSRVEVFGRCLPATQVARSLTIIALGMLIVMVTAGLLVTFEHQPRNLAALSSNCPVPQSDAAALFVDYLYEATSAFATVGVSAGVTGDLSLPSRLLICIVMFLGRVGPVTMLLAMAAPIDQGRYDYPEERVSLG
ncbi:MAG: TrkH family potassium uptake protein, partial [Planctomycetaceae bacterium]|nr:TrkH family potassium uptake protein [Planctomycetaceae bacterium]